MFYLCFSGKGFPLPEISHLIPPVMKNLVLVSFMLLAFGSCGNRGGNPEGGDNNKPDDSKVVIVFKEMQPKEAQGLRKGLSATNLAPFAYIGEHGFPVCLDRGYCQDTMTLSTIDGHLEVAFQYKTL